MENKGYFAVIPANVRYAEIPNGAKLLFGEITALCNDKGYCWATNSYFANLYGVDARTIIRWINALEDNEFIERDTIYKPNSKEIDKRIIRLGGVTKMSLGGDKNVTTPHDKNVSTPRDKNVTENNTYINNTFSVSEDTLENNLSETSSDDCTQTSLAEECKQKADDLRVGQIVNEFNTVCKELPKVKKITPQRRKKVKARLKSFSIRDIYLAFSTASYSSFLNGYNDTGWKATFDWFFENDSNITKVLEGNYNNKASPTNKASFNNFNQRKYDMKELEEKMLSG